MPMSVDMRYINVDSIHLDHFFCTTSFLKIPYFFYFQHAGSLTVIFVHALDILLTYVSSFSTLLTCLQQV